MLIDIGLNLTSKQFGEDRADVVQRARNADVGIMVLTGTDIQHSQKAYDLTQRYPSILFSTSGMHPHHAKEWTTQTQKTLHALAAHPEVVAIGECGLDFNRDLSPRKDQEYCFESQLEMAVDTGMPVFLHERDAHDRFIQILGRYRDRLPGAVVHCFTGNESQLRAYLDMDCHIGITGWICDTRRGLHMHDFIDIIPANRLMVETDAPYLLPGTIRTPLKHRRNEPMYLPVIVEMLASIRGDTVKQLAEITTANAIQFFGLPAAKTNEKETDLFSTPPK